MSEFVQIILLAIIQGVAEFLPISSSGHLVFFSELFQHCGAKPLEETLMVTIILH